MATITVLDEAGLARHLKETVEVFCDAFAEPPHREDWRSPEADSVESQLRKYASEGTLMVALVDGRVAGLGALQDSHRTDRFELLEREVPGASSAVYLAELAIAPAAQGLGLGRALCTRLLDAVGDRMCYLRVACDAAGARALYRSLGFEEVPGSRHPVHAVRLPGYPPELHSTDERVFLVRPAPGTRPDVPEAP